MHLLSFISSIHLVSQNLNPCLTIHPYFLSLHPFPLLHFHYFFFSFFPTDAIFPDFPMSKNVPFLKFLNTSRKMLHQESTHTNIQISISHTTNGPLTRLYLQMALFNYPFSTIFLLLTCVFSQKGQKTQLILI